MKSFNATWVSTAMNTCIYYTFDSDFYFCLLVVYLESFTVDIFFMSPASIWGGYLKSCVLEALLPVEEPSVRWLTARIHLVLGWEKPSTNQQRIIIWELGDWCQSNVFCWIEISDFCQSFKGTQSPLHSHLWVFSDHVILALQLHTCTHTCSVTYTSSIQWSLMICSYFYCLFISEKFWKDPSKLLSTAV